MPPHDLFWLTVFAITATGVVLVIAVEAWRADRQDQRDLDKLDDTIFDQLDDTLFERDDIAAQLAKAQATNVSLQQQLDDMTAQLDASLKREEPELYQEPDPKRIIKINEGAHGYE